LKWPKNTRLRQHPACSQIFGFWHMKIFSVSAVPSSTDDFVWMIFAFRNPTPFFLNQAARQKAAI
jgi:hypothetical protein